MNVARRSMRAALSARLLIAALGLLALAASASAEGAWVLWSAAGETRNGQTWRGPWEPDSGANPC
jgi:hypothetical protein